MKRRTIKGRQPAGAVRQARRLLFRVVRRVGRTVLGVVPRSLRTPAANDPKA
jgi:phage gp29-like protein